MKNLKFLMLTLLLFVFMVPVKAMPNYSVQKTETIFQKQTDSLSVITLVNTEITVFILQSRAKVPQTPFYDNYKSSVFGSMEKRKPTSIDLRYQESNFSTNFLLENLPDKK